MLQRWLSAVVLCWRYCRKDKSHISSIMTIRVEAAHWHFAVLAPRGSHKWLELQSLGNSSQVKSASNSPRDSRGLPPLLPPAHPSLIFPSSHLHRVSTYSCVAKCLVMSTLMHHDLHRHRRRRACNLRCFPTSNFSIQIMSIASKLDSLVQHDGRQIRPYNSISPGFQLCLRYVSSSL